MKGVVEWLRGYNSTRGRQEQVGFYGRAA